jgi:hypothetical protein
MSVKGMPPKLLRFDTMTDQFRILARIEIQA